MLQRSANKQQKRELMERLLQKLTVSESPSPLGSMEGSGGRPAFTTSAERPFTRECAYETGERPSLTLAVHTKMTFWLAACLLTCTVHPSNAVSRLKTTFAIPRSVWLT